MANIGKQFATKGLNRKGEGLVQIYVNFSRTDRKVMSTGVKVEPYCWDSKKSMVVKHPKAAEYNSIIDNMISDIRNLEIDCIIKKKPFNKEAIDRLLNDDTSDEIFNEFYRRELEKQDITYGTYKDQEKTLTHLNSFKQRIKFSAINVNLIMDFDAYLKQKGHMSSTVASHHKNIKKYLNLAILKGYFSGDITKNPYKYFKPKITASERIFLTFKEIKKIYKAEYPTDRLRKAADRFVFACCTGLRISDLSRVTPEKFDGNNLKMKPEKTSRTSGAAVYLPIKDLFKGLPYKILKQYDFTLPTFSDADYNNLLKIIAHTSKVPPITSHVARHTFLTMIALHTGNLFSVMQLGGITSTDTAMIYIHMAQDFSGEALKGIDWPDIDTD